MLNTSHNVLVKMKLQFVCVYFLCSDLHSYIPETSQSIPFSVQSLKAEKGGVADHTLSLFNSRELSPSLNGAMLFAGGPVWSMDWLPISDSSMEQYVALCAYRGLNEVRLVCR